MEWEAYKTHVKNALDDFNFDKEILSVLRNSIKNNQKIFVGGNGGSAAIAMHYVCDFSKGASQNWLENTNRYKAICLTSNISYITAISNDEQYDDVFKQQLINLASPNDILIMISSSGNSPNIIKAVKWANNNGLITIGISGFTGGKLKQLSKYSAHLTHNRYEVCEDVHHVFGQFLATHLREGESSEEIGKTENDEEKEKLIEKIKSMAEKELQPKKSESITPGPDAEKTEKTSEKKLFR
jgi:D-sedoheptulose 7-phosphate isomerase